MYCTNCGKEIDDDSNVCPYCGNPVEGRIIPVQAPRQGPAPANPNAFPVVAPVPQQASGPKHRSNAALVIAIIAAAVAASVILAPRVLAFLDARAQDAVNESRLESDFSSQTTFMKGIASDDYVETSNYSIQSVEMGKKTVDGDNLLLTCVISMQNDYFLESATVTARYQRGFMGYSLAGYSIDTATVTPIRGVSHDDTNGLTEMDPAFSPSDPYSCSYVEKGSIQNFWYGTAQSTETYSYRFNTSANAWRSAGSAESSLTLVSGEDSIQGSFIDDRSLDYSTHGHWSSLSITNVDLDTETCDVSWEWTSRYYDVASTDSQTTITRTNHATLAPRSDGTILVTIEPSWGSSPSYTSGDISGTAILSKDGITLGDGYLYFLVGPSRTKQTAGFNQHLLPRK
jgi:hypothetical protein